MSEFRVPAAALLVHLESTIQVALHAGAERIAQDARAHAPQLQSASQYRVPGALKNAIQVRDKPASGGHLGVAIGVDESAAFYWRFQEFGFHAVGGKRIGGGTRARPGRLQARVAAGSARRVPGLHFLQNAFESNQAAVVDLVSSQVQATLVEANQP